MLLATNAFAAGHPRIRTRVATVREGGATSAPVDFEGRTYESLADAFLRTCPQLDDLAFSHAWSGPIALTTRMAVHFQRYLGGAVRPAVPSGRGW
mgnify:FL=1